MEGLTDFFELAFITQLLCFPSFNIYHVSIVISLVVSPAWLRWTWAEMIWVLKSLAIYNVIVHKWIHKSYRAWGTFLLVELDPYQYHSQPGVGPDGCNLRPIGWDWGVWRAWWPLSPLLSSRWLTLGTAKTNPIRHPRLARPAYEPHNPSFIIYGSVMGGLG